MATRGGGSGQHQVGCQRVPERMEISPLILGINELNFNLLEIGFEGFHVGHEGGEH